MKNLFRKLLIVGGILLSLAIFADIANACSCRPTETVEKVFAKTPNVVILKLQSLKQNEGEAVTYFFSVEKVFKGELKAEESFIFKPGSMCDWYFDKKDIGTEFLFYLGERPADGKFWTASRCSRSGRVESKTDDLAYLENESNLRGKTRLSGKFEKRIETLDAPDDVSFPPIANQKVRIEGMNKIVELVTDANGFYEIYDLPAGKYRITPEKIEGFAFSSDNSDFEEVEINVQSQTEQNFIYRINNEISEKVTDSSGKPIEEVCVDLISLKTKKVLGFAHRSCTNKTGEFEISGIPVGNYKIVVNNGKADVFDLLDANPFLNKFFYPNVKTEKEAAEISVKADYFLKNLVLVPPEMAKTINLSGRLLFSDGKPVAKTMVKFIKQKDIVEALSAVVFVSDFEILTDENGRFDLKVLKGQKGILIGSIYAFPGAYENCPQIDTIIKKKNANFVQINTPDVKISGTESLAGIELKFPFQGCKEAKID